MVYPDIIKVLYIINIQYFLSSDPKGTLLEPFLKEYSSFIIAPTEEEKAILVAASGFLVA